MAKTTITFTPKRAIISPAPPLDEFGDYEPYTIQISLSQFDHSEDVKKTSSTSLSGIIQESLYYYTETYSCRSVVSAIKPDGTGEDSVSTDEMEMFFKSVIAGEYFTMTNIDTGELMNVQMRGRPSKERVSDTHLNEYQYSFNVREVTDL